MDYQKKAFEVEISNGGPRGYETAITLKLPATWAEFHDALQKARIPDGRNCGIELTRSWWAGLSSELIGGAQNLYELNLFAMRLTMLTSVELLSMDGLLKMEQARGTKSIPIPRLINLTFNADCHILPDVFNDESLGAFLYENEMLTKEAMCLLDTTEPGSGYHGRLLEVFGEEHRQTIGGVFTSCGYMESNGESFEEVYRPGQMAYFVLERRMPVDYHKELKKKMSASYERQVKQWMASDPAQLIAAAEDIAAIRFIHENLVDTISDEDASFLLTLDDPLGDVSSKWVEENGSDMVHDDDIHHCIWSLWEECTDGQTQKEDGIYQLISNAENEMKEYAHKVKQLSADKIYQHSAETAAKENLLCSIIHDSYDLDDADLAKILQQEEPLDTLYQFLLGGKTDLSSESSISSILNEYNAQCQEETATMDTGVTLC